MKRKNIISALLLAGMLVATPMATNAAGLGKLKVISALGQPLRAEIDLLSIPKDEIDLVTAKIAPVDAYKQARIERQEGLSAVRFTVEKRPNGEPYLKVSSTQAFNEPFIQLLIQLDWPTGRLLREYTVLLDPPGFQEAPATPSISAPVSKAEPAVRPAKAVEAPAVTEKPRKARKAVAEKPPIEPKAKKLAKKEVKEAPILKAEPAPQLTPAEQTFPRFDGSDQEKPAVTEQQPTPIVTAVPEQQEYQVKKGDTLAKIARELQVEGYSLEQMMVALYETNKDAFAGNNMNRIKAGKTLNVPDSAAIDASSTSKAAAAKEIKAHAADWNAYRQKLAATVAEQQPVKEEAKPEAAGKITAKAEDKGAKPEEPGKDVLKLSKGEAAGSGAAAKALQEKLTAAQDEAVAKEKALKEANSRIAELDKNVKDMQALLELKNKQLAELEKQAQAKPAAAPPPAAPAAEAPKPEVTPEPVPAPVAEPTPAPVAEAKPEPKKAEAKPKKPIPPPEPETSFMDTVLSNPLYLGGGAAAIVGALFAGLWALGRRRKKSLASFEDSIMTGGDLKTNTVFGNTAGGQIDTGDTSFLTDFSQAGMGAIDTNDVDPIAEAEVYMAYGRDAQAEEILKEAMSKDPTRHEVQLKLLEIYAGRKNTGAFETLAGELYAATSGQGPIWKKAAELGRGLDPANPLYAVPEDAGEGGAMAAAAVGAGAVAATAAAQDLDFSLDLDTQGGATQPAAAEDLQESMGALDFDLDTVGGLTPPAATAEAAASAETMEQADDLAAMDFNLDTIIPQAVEKKSEEPGMMADLGLDNLKFDIPELPDATPAAAPATAPSMEEEDTLALDFDFNLDQEPSADVGMKASATEEPLMPELDLSGIDLNLEETAAPQAPMAESGAHSLEDATTLVGDSTVWEEASTKLDLARAYLEMGDKEGAREILQEVAGEGGPEQQAEANKLLATLS